jgi:uncharacterized protein (DUF885 family)
MPTHNPDTSAESVRPRAEAELGPRFDIKAVHERVLATGAVTVGMLQEVVRRWIDERK